ncbi:hypothetical protein K3495_g6700 [Podosphaera aphanis]|nr:hypothetical protein K3495_g6700 [Podosphaera aphanis]
MSITTKAVPTEAHHSIGLVERYHTPLRRAYEVISNDLGKNNINKYHILQMAVKAVNDTAGPNGIVPTLLVFGAYPRMTESDPPAPSIFQRAAAIKSAMKEVRIIHAKAQVQSALRMRNGPEISALKDLPLNSQVLVWRESKKWTGPHKLLQIDGENCIVQIGDHTSTFRTTSVKPYYNMEEKPDPIIALETPIPKHDEVLNNKVADTTEPRRGTRIRKPKDFGNFIMSIDNQVTISSFQTSNFLSSKEISDRDLSIRLRSEGKITTPGKPFEVSRKKEIEDLISQCIFEVISQDSVGPDERVFNARMVDAVKFSDTSPYEKSRLVVQAYNDTGKTSILTQSPTIQRNSRRLITALAPGLIKSRKFSLILRDLGISLKHTSKLQHHLTDGSSSNHPERFLIYFHHLRFF